MSYLAVKYLHTLAAAVTLAGFLLRGYWMINASGRLQQRVTRIAPHVVDSVLFLAGVALLVMLSLNPLTQPWMVAKLAGLAAYVVLGSLALKRGRTAEIRLLAFVGSLAVFAYVVGVALAKSPASWLAYLV